MKTFGIIIVLAFHLFKVRAQGEVVIIDPKVNPGKVLKDYPLPSPTLKGSNYVSDEWHIGDLYLKSGQKAEKHPIKYDISNAFLEIKVGDIIKICPLRDIKSFEWLVPEAYGETFKFINCDNYKYNGTPLLGVFQVLVEGKADLLLKYRTEIVKGNYVQGLDMGERDSKIIKKEDFYSQVDGIVHKIINNKDANLDLFGPEKSKMEEYIRVNKLKFTRKNDLILIFIYFNSLIQTK